MTSKFRGKIGYSLGPREIAPGVIEDVPVEREYYCDMSRIGVNSRIGENILPELDITNQFSIMADAFALDNFSAMRYIEWAGAAWTIKQVEVQRPRLIVRVGGVYNGPKAPVTSPPGNSDGENQSG